jgi:WD40 repeat protein
VKNRAIYYFLLVLLLITGCDWTQPASTVTVTPATIEPAITSTLEVPVETRDLPISPDNAADVKLLRTFDERLGRIWTMAFSADGKYFAYTNQNGLNLQNAANSEPVFTFSLLEPNTFNSFTFSPDGTLLASPQTIWDVQSHQVLHKLDGFGYFHACFSPDGAWLAVSGEQPIQIWDVASGQLVRTFESKPDSHSFSVSISPDGTLLADSGSDGRITLWDVASGKTVRSLSHGRQNDVHDIQFSPDGKLLVSVGTDSAVRLWDVSSGQVLQTMMHGDGLYGVAFSPDGRLVASASCDRTVKLWEVATGRLVNSLRHGDEVTAVAFSPDGALLASASYEEKIYFWSIPGD